jgi:alpha-1,4-digalacturonate transport system permease protein
MTKQGNGVKTLIPLLKIGLIVVLAFIFFMPMFWVVLSAFKSETELVQIPPRLFPVRWTIENFSSGLQFGNFVVFFKNSTVVTVLSTTITVVISTMAAYAFAKHEFYGKKVLFMIIMATLMFSLEIIMIPMFLTLKRFGLLNSIWGIIIPPAATPTGIFLIRQHMQSIPDELLESAKIDGAKDFSIFLRIIVPLSLPAISTLAIFSFVWRWNDYLWPFLVINDDSMRTVPLALANFVGQYAVRWGDLLAMTTLSIIPTLIIFLFFQRYFMRGISSTGLKA